jgi:hypothetical protein
MRWEGMANGHYLIILILIIEACLASVALGGVTPPQVISPVEGDLKVVRPSDYAQKCPAGDFWCLENACLNDPGCANKWRFVQYFDNAGKYGHFKDGGVLYADDTYAWDVNLRADADNDKTVYAVAPGTVVDYGGPTSGAKGEVLIEHSYQGSKWWSGYLHMNPVPGIKGKSVSENTPIGKISHKGVVANHLHFVVYTGENSLTDGKSNLKSFDTQIEPRGAMPVTLTLYVHDGNRDGLYIPDATVTGHDGSGNSFQKTTDSNGYVTIEGDSGKWSFSASADGYETNDWDQEIIETDTKDASLQKEQQTSESSVVGKWAVHGEGSECKTILEGDGHEVVTNDNSGWDSVIDFYNDGTFTNSYMVDGLTETTTGEWTQYGDTVRLQYNPKPMNEPKCLDCSEDYVIEEWQSEGDTDEGTIKGDTMSGTSSSSGHGKSYSKQNPENVSYYDFSCSYRWYASRVDTGP